MPSKKTARKFLEHGRRAAFARLAGVSRTTVSLWLRGNRPSPRLEKLALEWNPSLVVPVSACQEDRTQPV
jgi:transcriptional regulator with XRE-family HTH domain